MSLSRPDSHEFAPYYGTYIDAAEQAIADTGAGALADLLTVQTVALRGLLDGVSDAMAARAYAPGKWTLLESLLHVADAERVFAYRMLSIGRGDPSPLPSFDQDAWVPESRANERTLSDILTEIDVVRASTLSLLYSLDDASLMRIGTASGKAVSARALAWIIGGHFAHHFALTRDRYLAGPAAV